MNYFRLFKGAIYSLTGLLLVSLGVFGVVCIFAAISTITWPAIVTALVIAAFIFVGSIGFGSLCKGFLKLVTPFREKKTQEPAKQEPDNEPEERLICKKTVRIDHVTQSIITRSESSSPEPEQIGELKSSSGESTYESPLLKPLKPFKKEGLFRRFRRNPDNYKTLGRRQSCPELGDMPHDDKQDVRPRK